MTIPEAIEVFVHAFAQGKSRTHPHLADLVDGIWILRDAPRTKGVYRKEEHIVFGLSPAEAHCIATANTRGWYFIGHMRAISEDDKPLRAAYKELNYRLLAREALFVHDLTKIEESEPPLPIVQVTEPELAAKLAARKGMKQYPPERLQPGSNVRQYVALDGDDPVGWVGSVRFKNAGWVSDLHVQETHRRRGIGRALMNRLLVDDRAAGLEASVLLATNAGAMLYPQVGYRQIGELLIYCPKR